MNTESIRFSKRQDAAINAVAHWLKHDAKTKQVFRLFGYAGTGKTTLARHLAGGLDGDTVFAAFTGKAALMMRKNGCADASTIHGLIYDPVHRPYVGVEFDLSEDSAAADAQLIVIDECSMVNRDLAEDLMSFNKPILVLGDPAQLPPVKGTGYFTDAKPDVMLTEIHRQARDNPIIELATMAREGRPLSIGTYGASRVVQRVGDLTVSEIKEANQILVGRNTTRTQVTNVMRRAHGHFSDLPEPGDRLVGSRNDYSIGILNGEFFTVQAPPEPGPEPDTIRLTLVSDDDPSRGPFKATALAACFNGDVENLGWRDRRGFQEFKFGNAVTVHKAQGSQWSDVIVWNESNVFRTDAARWLYTAITRAADRLTVIGAG